MTGDNRIEELVLERRGVDAIVRELDVIFVPGLQARRCPPWELPDHDRSIKLPREEPEEIGPPSAATTSVRVSGAR